MAKPSRPSAHDVARLAGVSQAAVSRAFTPGASISQATREKVLQAAQVLGYRPNLLARSLIKGESGIVGVVVGDMRDPLVATALNALSGQLSQAGKHMLLFTAEESAHADRQVEDLLKYRVDALLLMAASLSPQLAERCREEGIPVIFSNRQFGRNRAFPSVSSNNRQGAREIAEHLLQQGYRRPAVVTGSRELYANRERESAFAAHISKLGLAAPEVEIGNGDRAGAIPAVRRLLSREQRPDAIFCCNDQMAFAALEVARYEFGLEIGRDIGIAGFGDAEQAAWPSFDLTTYSHSVTAMVEAILQALLQTPGDNREPAHKIVDGILRIRSSTRRD